MLPRKRGRVPLLMSPFSKDDSKLEEGCAGLQLAEAHTLIALLNRNCAGFVFPATHEHFRPSVPARRNAPSLLAAADTISAAMASAHNPDSFIRRRNVSACTSNPSSLARCSDASAGPKSF
jgi:hypothetical protein